jgi:hypothetical protein
MKVCRVIATAVVGIVVAAGFSGAAVAQAPDWSYLEAGYSNLNVDDGSIDDDGAGWFAGANFEIFKSFHIFGRYNDNSLDDTDIDVTRWYVGAGWHGLLGEKADLLGEVAWVDSEFESGGIDDSDDGYFARVGARWRLAKMFEVGAFSRFEDVIEDEDDLLWEANAMVYVWRVAIGASADIGDYDTYNAFVRFGLGGTN